MSEFDITVENAYLLHVSAFTSDTGWAIKKTEDGYIFVYGDNLPLAARNLAAYAENFEPSDFLITVCDPLTKIILWQLDADFTFSGSLDRSDPRQQEFETALVQALRKG